MRALSVALEESPVAMYGFSQGGQTSLWAAHLAADRVAGHVPGGVFAEVAQGQVLAEVTGEKSGVGRHHAAHLAEQRS